MRFLVPASAVCISLMPLVAGLAVAPASMLANVPSSATPAPTPADAPDAPAKHAKRTACLKEAKARKLLGADKTAFIKECLAKP